MKNKIWGILKYLLFFYLLFCGLLFMFQEKIIFFPQKLDKDYQFRFVQEFEEVWIQAPDGVKLHGLLFQTKNPKGLIFYLKGNAGSVASWGNVAKTYTELNYDIFLLDYRGYGKSGGTISSEEQFLEDIQVVYEELEQKYPEDQIVVLGYSIGTGPAAMIASTNEPGLLILQAPFYNMTDLMRQNYPIIPTFLLKYKFETNQYLKSYKGPIVIFHGKQDTVIPYRASLMLKEEFEDQVSLFILEEQGHNGMTDNPEYKSHIHKILTK